MAKRREKKQVCSSNSSSNRAGLPDELLDLILEKLEKLVSLVEIIRFSSVCKSWNPKALRIKEKRMRMINHQPPWLLINSRDPKYWKKRKLSLFNFTDGSEILNFKLKIHSQYKHKECFGSSHGWLFYKDTIKSSKIVVLNPISGTVIHLPPISIPGDFRNSFENVDYLALSNDPFLGSFQVLATFPDKGIVAHLKFGDEIWTYSEKGKLNIASYNYAFYKNCIFAVSEWGKIFSLDIMHSKNESCSRIIEVNEIAPDFGDISWLSSPILSTFVETTNGDPLVVYVYKKIFDFQSRTYSVFKIAYSNGKFDRIPVANLDGHCFFFKNNSYHPHQCISVLASNFDGCRANSIYIPYGFRKVRIEEQRFVKCSIEEFNLEDQSVQTKEQRFPISQIGSIDTTFWLVPSVKHG